MSQGKVSKIPLIQHLIIQHFWQVSAGSYVICNFQCTYWFCDFILAYLDFIESIELLQCLAKDPKLHKQGTAGKGICNFNDSSETWNY
jgi:hypothetical protein